MSKKQPPYKIYCPERYTEIENYEQAKADNFDGWICHHRLGEHCFTRKELIEYGLYNDRTPGELKFVTESEHKSLHKKGSRMSDEQKSKLSASHKGKKPWNMGISCPEDTRCKISNTLKGRPLSEETRRKMSESRRGRAGPTKGMKWKLVGGKRIYYK